MTAVVASVIVDTMLPGDGEVALLATLAHI